MKNYGIRKCVMCGNDIVIFHKHRLLVENITCSKKCSDELKRKKEREKDSYYNCKCPICGALFHLKKCKTSKSKNNYCSKKCFYESKKETMKGEKNHQFGLIGNLNSSWKSDTKITKYGYVLIRAPNHPFKDCDGFVREHRLIAEKFLLTPENSVEVDGKKYLKKEYDVHHIDGNKQNNSVENLVVLKKSEHISLHVSDRKKAVIKCDLKGIQLKEYESICMAAKENNINDNSIRNCIHKKTKTAGGYIWKEVKNE